MQIEKRRCLLCPTVDAIRAMNTRRNSFSGDRGLLVMQRAQLFATQEPGTWLAKHPVTVDLTALKNLRMNKTLNEFFKTIRQTA